MITPCKMRLPEKNREEMSRRVQECCFAEGVGWEIVGKVIKNLDKSFWYIETFLGFGDTAGFFENYDIPEITPIDFLKKYESEAGAKGYEVGDVRRYGAVGASVKSWPEYFKLDLSDCDPTERKARWEIIKKAIPRHARWSIQTDSPTAHYGEVGLCSRDSSVSDVLEEEITWEYFLDKYVKVKNDAAEILEQLVAEPNDPNLQMKTRDARNLFEREQVLADSQVKEVPRETIKRIIYIDDRPMSHRMGWEAE